MKIYTQDTAGIVQPPRKHQQGKSAVGGFDELLEKAMTPQGGQAVSANALAPLQGLSGLNLTVPSGVDRAQTVESIDKFLHLMEAYERKMADPRASLKEAYPLLRQMEAKATELIPTLESLPEGDKLKDILNRTLVASTVEVIKFNRGDYV